MTVTSQQTRTHLSSIFLQQDTHKKRSNSNSDFPPFCAVFWGRLEDNPYGLYASLLAFDMARDSSRRTVRRNLLVARIAGLFWVEKKKSAVHDDDVPPEKCIRCNV